MLAIAARRYSNQFASRTFPNPLRSTGAHQHQQGVPFGGAPGSFASAVVSFASVAGRCTLCSALLCPSLLSCFCWSRDLRLTIPCNPTAHIFTRRTFSRFNARTLWWFRWHGWRVCNRMAGASAWRRDTIDHGFSSSFASPLLFSRLLFCPLLSSPLLSFPLLSSSLLAAHISQPCSTETGIAGWPRSEDGILPRRSTAAFAHGWSAIPPPSWYGPAQLLWPTHVCSPRTARTAQARNPDTAASFACQWCAQVGFGLGRGRKERGREGDRERERGREREGEREEVQHRSGLRHAYPCYSCNPPPPTPPHPPHPIPPHPTA